MLMYKKRSVEYAICPLIFQANVTIVITVDTARRAKDTNVTVSIL